MPASLKIVFWVRKSLKLSEIINVSPWSNGIRVHRGRDSRELVLSLLCENTARRWLSASQEEVPNRNQISQTLSWTFNLQNDEKINFCCLRHLTYGILLRQLSRSNCSSVGKDIACNAGDLGLIPESVRYPGEGNRNPFQYSCLENLMNRGANQATILGVARVRHDCTTKPPPWEPCRQRIDKIRKAKPLAQFLVNSKLNKYSSLFLLLFIQWIFI